ncbi:MAG TPA: AraC family transcriptional regulator [Planctomycetota bacterium]|nr:AraC family transcriptional regulator [Planctomycetota bacterium]
MADATLPMALPQPTFVDLARLPPGWSQGPHSHDVHEINFVRRGRGVLVAGGREIRTGRGAIYLFLPGEQHAGWNGDEPAEILYVAVRFPGHPAIVRDASATPFFLTGAAAATAAPPLAALADLLAGTPPRSSPAAPLPDAALPHVLAIIAAMIEPVRAIGAGSSRQRELADNALARLAGAARRPPSLATVARDLGIGADHLGRAVSAVTGRSWPDLVAEQRVRAARELLRDADLPMREIARRVGLSGPRALARLVRRVTGRPPSALRA